MANLWTLVLATTAPIWWAGCSQVQAHDDLPPHSHGKQTMMKSSSPSPGAGAASDGVRYEDMDRTVWSRSSMGWTEADAEAGLSLDFYGGSCPEVYEIIEGYLEPIISSDPGQAAGLLRLFFHDCFVQGCDASILLVNPAGELLDPPNNQSIRLSSLLIIDAIKASLEKTCPSVVSCADILALSAATAIRLVGGPFIPMATGRRDSLFAASNQTVNNNIPLPTNSIADLKQIFQDHRLDVVDLVALSGGHTIGRAHCKALDSEVEYFHEMDPRVARELTRTCLPANNPQLQSNIVYLDSLTKDLFDNAYFKNVLAKRAIFHSDSQLLNSTDTCQLVQLYAHSQPLFFNQFTSSFLKMGRLGVLTGDLGLIRTKCSSSSLLP